MNTYLLPGLRGLARLLRGVLRLASRSVAAVAHVVTELNRTQRRATVAYLSYDGYLPEPDRPPDFYAEFLLRTSGPLVHEPPARSRLAGRMVG